MSALHSTSLLLATAALAILGIWPMAAIAPAPATAPSRTAVLTDVSPPDSCPVTQPPSEPFVPPAPYPTELRKDQFWIGSEKLWTWRPISGAHHGFREKVFWWRKGYDWRTENPPKLKISGKRLDGPAPPLFHMDGPNAAGLTNPAIGAAFNIPTVGCWAITANYKSDKLTYVIWVTQ
jgi:hypothetical protein